MTRRLEEFFETSTFGELSAENIYPAALEAFEFADTTFKGALTSAEADIAVEALCSLCGGGLERGSFDQFQSEAPFSFHAWLTHLPNVVTNLPEEARDGIIKASSGLRCVCGNWMERMLCSECYPGSSSISCDFSGDTIESSEVWHCPLNKSTPMHPLGCDVDVANTEAYREFGVMLRLEERLSSAIEKAAADVARTTVTEGLTGEEAQNDEAKKKLVELRARHIRLVAGMLSPLLEAYNIQKQVSSGNYVIQREGDVEWAARLKNMLATQDCWKAQWQETVAEMEGLLQEMREFALPVEKVRFKDEEDKKRQISSLEARFDAPSRHRNFEKMLRRLMRVMDLLQDIDGLQASQI